MTAAGDLIKKMEQETGQRWDEKGSLALSGLFGAVARMMGKSNHAERDDVVAGVVIQHQVSEEGRREQEAEAALVELLRAGMSPDDISRLVR